MSAEHTPGPWSAERVNGEDWVVLAQPSGITICLLETNGLAEEVEAAEADARFMAASPEMFAVLELVEAWHASNSRAEFPIEFVRDAIKKASGEIP